jgi:hypothetical protein
MRRLSIEVRRALHREVTRNVWLRARSEIDTELRKLGRIARAFGSLRRTGRLDSV